MSNVSGNTKMAFDSSAEESAKNVGRAMNFDHPEWVVGRDLFAGLST